MMSNGPIAAMTRTAPIVNGTILLFQQQQQQPQRSSINSSSNNSSINNTQPSNSLPFISFTFYKNKLVSKIRSRNNNNNSMGPKKRNIIISSAVKHSNRSNGSNASGEGLGSLLNSTGLTSSDSNSSASATSSILHRGGFLLEVELIGGSGVLSSIKSNLSEVLSNIVLIRKKGTQQHQQYNGSASISSSGESSIHAHASSLLGGSGSGQDGLHQQDSEIIWECPIIGTVTAVSSSAPCTGASNGSASSSISSDNSGGGSSSCSSTKTADLVGLCVCGAEDGSVYTVSLCSGVRLTPPLVIGNNYKQSNI